MPCAALGNTTSGTDAIEDASPEEVWIVTVVNRTEYVFDTCGSVCKIMCGWCYHIVRQCFLFCESCALRWISAVLLFHSVSFLSVNFCCVVVSCCGLISAVLFHAVCYFLLCCCFMLCVIFCCVVSCCELFSAVLVHGVCWCSPIGFRHRNPPFKRHRGRKLWHWHKLSSVNMWRLR